MPWEKVADFKSLAAKPVVWKRPPKQIAVFRVEQRVFAVDNRCPHEGYPLAEGTVDEECLLTCNWHNWKFRLEDGRCVLGGDHVRSYPAKVEGGDVWVNTDDPPPEEMQAAILLGLKTAFDRRDFGRICRELARLHFNGLDTLAAVRKAVEWSHDRLEFGFTHAYAAAADWLALAGEYGQDWERRLVCLAEAVDHMAFDTLRRPPFPYAANDAPFDQSAFASAVENEQLGEAESMVRGGLAEGLHWADMEQAFASAALRHYNSFGHSLIYVQKTGELLKSAGESLEPLLLPALARHLVYATREDLLPEFRDYAAMPAQCPAPGQTARQDDAALDASSLFPIATRPALEWVRRGLAEHRPANLYDALLAALARNLLHYDMSFQFAYDRPVNDNVGWLDFTHGVTFASAVRSICRRHPRLWTAGLLQMALFLGRNRRYLDLELDESAWFVSDQEAFFAETRELLLDHGQRDPIFSAHLLKTARAVEGELPGASPGCRRYLLAGLNRFLHSPIKQKHVRRLARQAIDLVQRDFR